MHHVHAEKCHDLFPIMAMATASFGFCSIRGRPNFLSQGPFIVLQRLRGTETRVVSIVAWDRDTSVQAFPSAWPVGHRINEGVQNIHSVFVAVMMKTGVLKFLRPFFYIKNSNKSVCTICKLFNTDWSVCLWCSWNLVGFTVKKRVDLQNVASRVQRNQPTKTVGQEHHTWHFFFERVLLPPPFSLRGRGKTVSGGKGRGGEKARKGKSLSLLSPPLSMPAT